MGPKKTASHVGINGQSTLPHPGRGGGCQHYPNVCCTQNQPVVFTQGVTGMNGGIGGVGSGVPRDDGGIPPGIIEPWEETLTMAPFTPRAISPFATTCDAAGALP